MSLFNKTITVSAFYQKDFIDIHSHLLPGIDDGAKNMEDAIALIQKMQSYGIQNFRTTPHVMGGVWENSTAIIKQKEAELKNALIAKGINNINIHAAAEYMMDDNFSKLLNKHDIIPLKDNYILVEMSFFNAPIHLDDILFDIQLKGYIPILAHPERYHFYHNDFSQYERLIKAGCLFQLNILSLTEQYGKPVTKIAQKLLKKGLYSFVGTDTHHKNHLHLMKTIATQKNKKLLTPLFDNNIKTFSF